MCALTRAHKHKPHDHRREELSRIHRPFLILSVGEDKIKMSIHSGVVGIAIRIYELEARLLGANGEASYAAGQEEVCGRESTCNRRTWKVVCQRV